MARSETGSSKSRPWAWPVGILIGLAVGIPTFGSKGGVAFGVALGIAFAIALGATRGRVEGDATGGGSVEAVGSNEDGTPAHLSRQDESDGEEAGSSADGARRA
ncbi:hypothetical protein [Micromonospora sp. NPDC049274]|uniref:hypothetical protein n=1 Tax=Micromonospora sp. NPDC049274 TaxID=3154829 RepID=UPI00343123BC